uniref:Uncharacterized protein n=1 Tax=Rhizophora mucronata TaxID=61149 RepID=A0A2P2QGV9_RHIMU
MHQKENRKFKCMPYTKNAENAKQLDDYKLPKFTTTPSMDPLHKKMALAS